MYNKFITRLKDRPQRYVIYNYLLSCLLVLIEKFYMFHSNLFYNQFHKLGIIEANALEGIISTRTKKMTLQMTMDDTHCFEQLCG